ncbi:MAG: hypothetical protein LBI85_08605, partial [Spirochaetaceae bacterium]|nr:hypothetical protein [Spirochaetaceae bacterium]
MGNIDVRDTIDTTKNRLLGNFIMTNTGYDAELDSIATELKVTAGVRDFGTTLVYDMFASMEDASGPPVESNGTGVFNFTDLPPQARSMDIRITTENKILFEANTEYGKKTYWINVRLADEATFLSNIEIRGYEAGSNTPITLYKYAPPFIDSGRIELKDPASFTLSDPTVTNITFDIKGKITRIEIIGE